MLKFEVRLGVRFKLIMGTLLFAEIDFDLDLIFYLSLNYNKVCLGVLFSLSSYLKAK